MRPDDRLARGLGWFSIGLGVAQVVAPRALARLIGVRNHAALPALGAREILSGMAILSRPNPTGGLLARVGGDAMDLALLGRELGSDNPNRNRVCIAAAAVTAVTALDVLCAQKLAEESSNLSKPLLGSTDVIKAVTIDRPAEELYSFWRNFENLPQIMPHLQSVTVLDERRSRWVATAPMGTVEWEAEVTEDRPNERIAWRSLEGSQVETSGDVRFMRATGGRGTVVRVAMRYNPPAGLLGKTAAMITRENPERQVYEALRAFKQVMEVGEITRSEGTVIGETIKQKPAQMPLAA